MKYIKQFGIILGITCIGEGLKYLIPFPVPGSIYGLVLLLLLLIFKVVKLEQVKEAGEFLVGIMPLMFIPPAVGLMDSWDQIQGMLLPFCVVILATTCLVMAVTGKVADFMLDRREKKKEGGNE